MEPFQEGKITNCDKDFDTSNVRDKTAVITGGANGMGEAYVRAIVKAGGFVVFGDIDDECGKQVAAEVGDRAQYVHCDVTKWSDQLAVFKQAIANSPNHRIDIVIANAGISGFDDVFVQDLDLEDPVEPELKVTKVNSIAVLYTTKLALHYFRRQFKLQPEASKDQLLVMQGSLAGYVDLRGAVQYAFSKYGMRGAMRNLRRTEHAHNIRVNYIAPWFIKTKILSPAVIENLTKAGFEFAEVDSAARAVMKLCSDATINGRTLCIVPFSYQESGYMDVDADHYTADPMAAWQESATGAQHRQMTREQQATKGNF